MEQDILKARNGSLGLAAHWRRLLAFWEGRSSRSSQYWMGYKRGQAKAQYSTAYHLTLLLEKHGVEPIRTTPDRHSYLEAEIAKRLRQKEAKQASS